MLGLYYRKISVHTQLCLHPANSHPYWYLVNGLLITGISQVTVEH